MEISQELVESTPADWPKDSESASLTSNSDGCRS